MRIIIDTNDATPSQAAQAGQTAAADVDAGFGSQSFSSAPGGALSTRLSGTLGATDSGGPPAWLLDAVGSTQEASEVLARIGKRSAPGLDSAADSDAGAGPASAPGASRV